MDKGFDIYVPCEIFEVQIWVGPDQFLSSLEKLTLEAIYAGVRNFSELEQLLGVGHRPTLDLIFDLWHRGYVLIDTSRDEIHLADVVKHKIAEGKTDSLEGGERVEQKERLMQELLSGHILPVGPSLRGGDREPASLIAPPDLPSGSFVKARTGEMLSVLDQMMQRRGPSGQSGRALKVLEINLDLAPTAGFTPIGRPRNLHLYVDCDLGSRDTILFHILYPTELSSSVRRDMERSLQRLSREHSAHIFFKQLRAKIGNRQPLALTPLLETPSARESLRLHIRELEHILPAQILQKHHQLIDLHEKAQDEGANSVTTVLLKDPAELANKVESVIKAAKHQLVLGTSEHHYRGLMRLFDALEAALQRDVQCFLLWGKSREAVLDARLINVLTSLSQRFPMLLHWSPLPARSRLNFLVQDGSGLFFSQSDVLGDVKVGEGSFGVWVSSMIEAMPCRAALDMLVHAQRIVPDYSRAQRMFTLPEEMGFIEKPWPVPQPPTAIESEPSGDGLQEMARKLWLRDWRLVEDRLPHGSVARTSAIASLVPDVEHDRLLREFLSTARERLIILTDRLDPAVADSGFLTALDVLLERGVQVWLGYGTTSPEVEQKFRFIEQSRRNFRFICVDKMAGSLLVSDNWSFITSVPLLGIEQERNPRHRRSTDCGLLIHSETLSNQAQAAALKDQRIKRD